MMNIALHELRSLAQSLVSSEDRRSAFLKNLPSASDNTAMYYRFFYELSMRYAPFKALEIGTYLGSSAAHLSANNTASVVTVDVDPNATKAVLALNLPNVYAVNKSSDEYVSGYMGAPEFDILFIDALHNFKDAYTQYFTLRPLLKKDALVFFDDTNLNEEMRRLWIAIPDEKLDLTVLHYTGFGAAKVTPGVNPKPLSAVLGSN